MGTKCWRVEHYILGFGAGAAAWRSSRRAARSLPGPTSCCPPGRPGWLGYNIGRGIGAFGLAPIGAAAAMSSERRARAGGTSLSRRAAVPAGDAGEALTG